MTIYTVQPGDSVWSIAREHGVPPMRIILDNGLGEDGTDPSRLVVGQTLVITYPTQSYTVRGGDTLEGIAERFGVSLNQLWRNNPWLGGETSLEPGQSLAITLPPPEYGPLNVTGYVYPFVSRGVLRSILPFLTYLSVFAYGINEDGTLIIPTYYEDEETNIRNVEEVIALAREYGVPPLLTLTAMTPDGVFSSELAARLMSDTALQDAVIASLVKTVNEKGYGGVDMDFEYIPPEHAQDYVKFIQKAHDALAPLGKVVFVALAPKTSDEQPGLLYQGHDYAGLGAAADKALLMTYEWGYTYGPPMAVAPLNRVAEVVEYAVSKIDPARIHMGIPNYGYDWRLPFVRGESAARTITNVGGVVLAGERHAAIEFDPVAMSPHFNYWVWDPQERRNAEHEVWFEDARSIEAKLKLARGYGLAGVGYWTLMSWFPQNWAVLNSMFEINKVNNL